MPDISCPNDKPLILIVDDDRLMRTAFFIAKPINPELMVHRIRYMLRASRSIIETREAEERLMILKVAFSG